MSQLPGEASQKTKPAQNRFPEATAISHIKRHNVTINGTRNAIYHFRSIAIKKQSECPPKISTPFQFSGRAIDNWELACFILTIGSTLPVRASARQLTSAGCRVAARGELSSSPASSSPSTALGGPPPSTWPRLGVGWRRAGSPPVSSSPSTAVTAICGPPPGTWPRLARVSGGEGRAGACRLHLHHGLHSAGLRPAHGLCWVLGGRAARGEPAGFIFTIGCTLRASARHLAFESAGWRVVASEKLACFIFTIESSTALCGPPPGNWPRLGVCGGRARGLPASSSPSTALCRPPPGTWPRLGVGWRKAESSPASSSRSTALRGPPPGTWPRLGVEWRRAGSLPVSSSP
jgi:hypothetical protein